MDIDELKEEVDRIQKSHSWTHARKRSRKVCEFEVHDPVQKAYNEKYKDLPSGVKFYRDIAIFSKQHLQSNDFIKMLSKDDKLKKEEFTN